MSVEDLINETFKNELKQTNFDNEKHWLILIEQSKNSVKFARMLEIIINTPCSCRSDWFCYVCSMKKAINKIAEEQ